MPVTPIAVGCEIPVEFMRSKTVAGTVDQLRFQFRRSAMPVSIDRGFKFGANQTGARHLPAAQMARDRLNVAGAQTHSIDASTVYLLVLLIIARRDAA